MAFARCAPDTGLTNNGPFLDSSSFQKPPRSREMKPIQGDIAFDSVCCVGIAAQGRRALNLLDASELGGGYGKQGR